MQRVHVDRVDLDLTAPLVPLLVFDRDRARSSAIDDQDTSRARSKICRAAQLSYGVHVGKERMG